MYFKHIMIGTHQRVEWYVFSKSAPQKKKKNMYIAYVSVFTTNHSMKNVDRKII